MDFSAVDQELANAIEQGVFPGAVVLVNQAGTVLYRQAVGWRSLEPVRTPLRARTVLDVASLTQPLATMVAVMLLSAEKQLCFDDRVARFLPQLAMPGKADITIRHLLTHASGFPAWRPYYREVLHLELQGGHEHFLGTRAAR